MENKTKEQLESEIGVIKALEKEREVSDDRYTLKWVERGAIALLGIIATVVLGILIQAIFNYFSKQ